MKRIGEGVRTEILRLRKRGHSIPEIAALTGVGKTTAQRYVKGVGVDAEFHARLRGRQGGSKERARAVRESCELSAGELLGCLNGRDRLLLLIGLYWGEGTKRDLSVINSDPQMLKTILQSLRELGVAENRFSLSLRLHGDLCVPDAKSFWSRTLGIPQGSITRVEVIEGKKKGKLPHGMCRLRVSSGLRECLLIQAMISLIGKAAEREYYPTTLS